MDVLDIYFVISNINEELNHLENIVNNHKIYLQKM